jgi:hypothetical protein
MKHVDYMHNPSEAFKGFSSEQIIRLTKLPRVIDFFFWLKKMTRPVMRNKHFFWGGALLFFTIVVSFFR